MIARIRRGFTLLEVMVSLAILALALTAVAGINANSFESSNYAKHLTVATLLARSKMIDVEEELRKDGLGDDDKEFDGDFEDEGYEKMKWQATCRKIEVDIGQLLGGLFGGEVSSESLPDQMQSFLGALNGEGTEDLVQQVGGSDLSKMLGGEMIENVFKQVGETLSNSIREITLEITWGEEPYQDSVTFVQYVTTSGRLNVPSGTFGLPKGVMPGSRTGAGGLPPTIPGGGKNPAAKKKGP